MISYRRADIINKITDKANQDIRQQAEGWLGQAARGHHVYQHNFEDMQIAEDTYEGILHVVYDAKFVKGYRQTMEDPGEGDSYEISILNYIILPGDVQDENGTKVYDLNTTIAIKDDVVEMLDESQIEQDIEESLHQRDRDY